MPLSVVETPNRKVVAGFTEPAATAAAQANGSVRLATVDVETLLPGRVELRIDGAELVGVSGQSLGNPSASVVISSGTATREYAAPRGPAHATRGRATGATHAPLDRATLTAAWAHAAEQDVPCPTPEPGTDLNGDGCLTIADVQHAAATTTSRASARTVDVAGARPALTVVFTVNSTADAGDSHIDGNLSDRKGR